LVERESSGRPFVSIGVTTYNRHDLLRQTLDSVLAQTFTDFEVIVGNDFTAETLTGEMFGISATRVRFVNHPHNLREVGNMNALLEMATGRYFTWLFDDDLYEPDFLQTGHDCLTEAGFPPAFFSSYRVIIGNEEFQPQKIPHSTMKKFTGREFLRWYPAFRIKMYPTYGLFDTAVLRNQLGGFIELSNAAAVGLFSEHLLLVKCALLDRVIYVDAPYYIYRQHEGSWSESTTDLKYYQTAGQELIRRSSEVLRHPSLVDDYSENLLKVCSFHLIEFAFKAGRHAHYISEPDRKEFGSRAAVSTILRHWRESWETRKLYRTLGGNNSLRNWVAFFKIMLFCDYLMISHFYHFFYGKKEV
jgi:glycosyltransferase involved in cell wall biosynthesis